MLSIATFKPYAEWEILCAGPSLAHAEFAYVPKSNRIAVNSALKHPTRHVAYWCNLNRPGTFDPGRLWPANLITGHEQVAKWREYGYKGEILVADRTFPYSTIAAIHFAASQGATVIRLYGCDMEGTGYFGRSANPHNKPERWAAEKNYLDEIVAELRVAGVEVRRMMNAEVVV